MTVDIVTPSKRVVEGVTSVSLSIPSTKGELQILPGHADMLALLGTGVMKLVADGHVRKFAVSFGFAEVSKDKVTILAETCEESTGIDKTRALNAQKKAEEQLEHTLSDDHYRKYQLKLQRALVRQQVSASA